MAYNKTITWQEFEGLAENASSQLYNAIKNAERVHAKLLSVAGGDTDAQIAARFDINLIDGVNTAAELEAAVADIRAMALTLKDITSAVTQPQIDSLVKFV